MGPDSDTAPHELPTSRVVVMFPAEFDVVASGTHRQEPSPTCVPPPNVRYHRSRCCLEPADGLHKFRPDYRALVVLRRTEPTYPCMPPPDAVTVLQYREDDVVLRPGAAAHQNIANDPDAGYRRHGRCRHLLVAEMALYAAISLTDQHVSSVGVDHRPGTFPDCTKTSKRR